MKMRVLCAALLIAASAQRLDSSYDERRQQYVQWTKKHSKTPSSKRYAVWANTLEEIAQHNKLHDQGKVSWWMGLNKFSDQTWEEFRSGLMAPQDCSATNNNATAATIQEFVGKEVGAPDAVDWRTGGYVSEVKDQGHCGSCWTFSTTGAVESHHRIKVGYMELFSEQQLLDCADNFDDHGCEGGLPSHAFEYIRYQGGIMSEAAYPYETTDKNGCRFDAYNISATVDGAYNITELAEDEMRDAVAMVGPVAMAYQVASDFKNYDGGVYTSKICKSTSQDVNHAVLAVGYNTNTTNPKSPMPYWIVKNSWGAEWGLEGYFYIERNKNMCGLATCSSFPLMTPK